MQSNNTFNLMLVLLLAAIVICLALWIAAAIGSIDITTGCLYRYNLDANGKIASTEGVTNTVIVKGNGNYTAVDSGASTTSLTLSQDPNSYGKWVNTNFYVKQGQNVDFEIKGEVSLCRSYLPTTNVQSTSNLNASGKVIAIPRVEETSEPLSLMFDAKLDEWRNLLQLFQNDEFVVSLSRDKKSSTGTSTFVNALTNATVSADCTDGKRTYSPICGRYSIFSGTYTQNCELDQVEFMVYQNVDATAPEPYRSDGLYTTPWKANINDYFINFVRYCMNEWYYVFAYQNSKFFWFSADNAAGLLYRYDNNLTPTSIKNRGTSYAQASILSNTGVYANDNQYRVILNVINNQTGIKYLQFRFADNDGAFANNTGGYILNVKHTKCRRVNGVGFNDTFTGRGFVELVVVPSGANPNSGASYPVQTLTPTSDGLTSFLVPSGSNGNVWLRVKNNSTDYIDSIGQYQVKMTGKMTKDTFFAQILNPMFERLKSTISGASKTVFKNMTCYQGIGAAEGKCTNFFNYVRAALILYIITYAAMFLLGSVKITQQDLVMRVIKVGIIAGLLNDKTYNFFSLYLFDFVTSFSDEIIANMSGYSLFTSSNSITNPFMFLDEVLTKIFLSKTFGAQMMALLAMGLNGVLYFIIIFVSLILVIIASLRGIAVYIMAYVAIAVLFGIAPLFLTFMLFKTTQHLFGNWLKYLIRYTLEPLVMLAGLIILMQLFTIYLDYVIGYSICWKCALAMKIPFPNIAGLSPAFLNVPVFCINWFAPWGMDNDTGQMGINMQHVVAMVILAFCMKNYIDFSSSLVSRITGAYGPSATGMGNAMSGAIGDKILESSGLSKENREMIKQELGSKVKDAMSGNKADGDDKLGGNRFDSSKSALSEGGDGGSGGGDGSASGAISSAMSSVAKGASDLISSGDKGGEGLKPSWSKVGSDADAKAQDKVSASSDEAKDKVSTPTSDAKDSASPSASAGWKSAVTPSSGRSGNIAIGNRRSVMDQSPGSSAAESGAKNDVSTPTGDAKATAASSASKGWKSSVTPSSERGNVAINNRRSASEKPSLETNATQSEKSSDATPGKTGGDSTGSSEDNKG